MDVCVCVYMMKYSNDSHACRDTIRNALLAVYGNKESVDKELVEVRTSSWERRGTPDIVCD